MGQMVQLSESFATNDKAYDAAQASVCMDRSVRLRHVRGARLEAIGSCLALGSRRLSDRPSNASIRRDRCPPAISERFARWTKSGH